MVNPVINKADNKAQNAADKETDGIFHGAVVLDIDHDQFKDAYHRQEQAIQPEGFGILIKSDHDAEDSEHEQTDTDDIIDDIVGIQNAEQ